MFLGKSRARSKGTRRSFTEYRPVGDQLEDKVLLSIDLGGTPPSISPHIATAPYGMAFGGATPSQGAGFSVADAPSLNGSGYDAYVIGAPTVGSNPGTIGSGAGAAYLVFGSQTVGVNTPTDWLSTINPYTAGDRVGDLGQLGAASQTNPITSTALGFPFAGITFVASSQTQGMLGASVAGLTLANGQGAIVIGAPGATDANGANPGTGRVYIISGSFNNFIGQTINLDNPTSYSGLNIITIVNSQAAGGQLGFSVAAGSNILGDGSTDVIIGAPAATIGTSTTPGAVTSNTGAVYVVSTRLLSGATQTIDAATLGQGGSQSVLLVGANSGDRAGFSVADGGDVNGVTSGGVPVDELLIGAPDANSSAGNVYLVNGGSNLATFAAVNNNVNYISLSRVGLSSNNVPGALIQGPGNNSLTGYSVSSAGDFNADGFGDILIGSPGYSSGSTTLSQGEATLLYGSINGITGTISLANPPAGTSPLTLTGANAGDMAGYAVAYTGFINANQPNNILVGAPGFNNSAGTAYLVPGRAAFTGTYSLGNAESAPISGIQFNLTTPSSPTGTPNYFGASLSSRFQGTQQFTGDGDSRADFIIGAPGYDITQNASRALAGGAMIIQSGYINVPIPASGSIVTQIGVGNPFAPFSISATTPANLQIYVFGTTTTNPSFHPVTDINPKTVVVNGVAYPTATIQQDPNANNYLNGIPDAIITISPRANLRLPSGTVTITITGQTLSTSPLANQTWTGSAQVTVTGGSGGGGGGGGGGSISFGGVGGSATGPVTETTFNSVYGNNQFTPSLTQLSAYNYQPIPISVALNQFMPPVGFRERIYSYYHPGKHLRGVQYNRGQNHQKAGGFNQLPSRVFNRDVFHPQRNYRWTHRAPKYVGFLGGVVPLQTATQTYNDIQLH